MKKYKLVVNEQFICELPLDIAVSMALTIWDKTGEKVVIADDKEIVYFERMHD